MLNLKVSNWLKGLSGTGFNLVPRISFHCKKRIPLMSKVAKASKYDCDVNLKRDSRKFVLQNNFVN